MRRMTKRICCTALALSMVLSQSVPVFATGADTTAAQSSEQNVDQTGGQSGEQNVDQTGGQSSEQNVDQTGGQSSEQNVDQTGGQSSEQNVDQTGGQSSEQNVDQTGGQNSGQNNDQPDEKAGYTVTFTTEHATIDVYYTQSYTTPSVCNITSAVARNSATGEIDVTGDGQVNFKVNVDEGYEVDTVSADGNYKNLKDSSDGLPDSFFRLTKITGAVAVTVKTKEAAPSNPADTPDQNQEQPAETVNKANIVINEIESNGDATDWVEIYNKGKEAVDISGWYITDDDKTRKVTGKTTPIAEGTMLQPGEFYVFDQNIDFTFGLGDPDEVNLFTGADELVEKRSWSTHANGVLARVPDGIGAMKDVTTPTKGSSNNDAVVPTEPEYKGAVDWPGSDKVITFDEGKSMFKEDSSGLDFYKGQLYCINNKKGTFWVMDVNKDGSLDYADGFTQTGKNLAFAYDSENASNSDPDAEGITVDGNGLAYAAVERDNNNKNVNANWILQFDPRAAGTTVVASKEWNITDLLPDVTANAGIESVEWVANDDVAGKLFDETAGAAFDPKNYPDAVASGIFFVALEANGHIYAFVLNKDGSAQRIADIDPGIGGAMALDYDKYEKYLWVGADDGYNNTSAKIKLNGTASPEVTLVNPPKEMDVARNNEGFAIAEPEFTVNGLRPVYHFMDGETSGVLTISYLNCDYKNDDSSDNKPEENGQGTGGNAGDGNNQQGSGSGTGA